MLNDYMNNFNNIVSTIFFVGFKIIVILLTTLLLFSLIMLAIGCLIKSQKIKSKFLKVAPSLLLGVIFMLCIPYIFVKLKMFL